jgi:hypothetical protein
MSNFGGRHMPNVTQYIRDLHEKPIVADDMSTLDDHALDIYTNSNFADLDTGITTDFRPPPTKELGETHGLADSLDVDPVLTGEISTLDFMTG